MNTNHFSSSLILRQDAFLSLILLLLFGSSLAVSAAGDEFPSSVAARIANCKWNNNNDNEDLPPTCDLYMAPSTIRGAGWGVFVSREYQIGDRIGTPSVGIPFLDFPTTNGDTTHVYGALSEYLWESADIGGFGEALRVDMFLPGPPSLINHHASLDNVVPSGLTQDNNFYRYSSPMAGASTAYTDFYLVAKRDIRMGEELFVDRTRNSQLEHPLYTTLLPSVKDYELVDGMVQAIAQQGLSSSLTPAQFQDMLYRLGAEILESGHPNRKDALRKLLPRTLDEFERCLEKGAARYRLIERSHDWIWKNGHCLDNIAAQPSNIPDAGQGAFATRSLSKGSTVSVTPMVTIAHGEWAMQVPMTSEGTSHPRYNNVHLEQEDKFFVPETRNNATFQLLTNYCLGHEHSDLFLCPTTQAALINHYQEIGPLLEDSANGRRQEPNVAVQWSHHSSRPQEEHVTLLSLDSITDVDETDLASYQTKLVMEYVALRDIQPGEELLLDYSGKWEGALANHLSHGQSSFRETAQTPRPSAKVMNEMESPIATSEEARPNHWAFFCRMYPNVKVVKNGNPGWEDFRTNSAINRNTWPEKIQRWYQYNTEAEKYPCNVVHIDQDRGVAAVEMLVKPLSMSTIGRRYQNIPLHRLEYADSIYHSDMHLEWAFRHFIPLPDAIFPLHWRRDYKSAKDWDLGMYEEVEITRAHEESYERALRKAKCGVYLAKSNIPNAGFGTYTGVDIPAAGIMVGSMLPVIPAFTPMQDSSGKRWPLADYVWDGGGFDAAAFEAWPEYSTSMVGVLFGCMANAHAGINNLHHDMGEWLPMLDARQVYGAGAFSDYYNTGFRTKYAVKAGEELFVSYGENWFLGRAKFADVPLAVNFREANAVISSVWALLSIAGISDADEFVSRLLPLIQDYCIDQANKRTISALKAVSSLDELQHVIERNGTAEATIERRSSEWLEENGLCQDHIFVNRSTIYNAGNGAFLRRHRPEDSIIVSMPLVVISREFVTMNTTRPSNHLQIITNYLLGHKDSSALFMPSSQAVTINHNSKRMKNGKEPNARLEFSKTDKRSLYYQSLPLKDLLKQKYTTMVIDAVATRDIEPDEEVFIDYGEDWENAWKDYVDKWESPCGSDPTSCLHSSQRIKAMNDDKFNKDYFEWSNVHVSLCFFNHTLLQSEGEIVYLSQEVPSDFTKAIDPRRKFSYEGIKSDHEGFDDLPSYGIRQGNFIGCKIMESASDENTFDVVYFVGKTKEAPNDRMIVRVKSIPDTYIRYQVRPFQSDIVVPGTFRHEIGIPDDQFPPLWKDLQDELNYA